MTDTPAWTLDEIVVYAKRYGLTTMRDDHLVRMVELANVVAAAGTAIPRQTKKSDEPASTFRVPLLSA
jgi:hypothetical protein